MRLQRLLVCALYSTCTHALEKMMFALLYVSQKGYFTDDGVNELFQGFGKTIHPFFKLVDLFFKMNNVGFPHWRVENDIVYCPYVCR